MSEHATPSPAQEAAALLNEACRRVVRTQREGSSEEREALHARLSEAGQRASGPRDPARFLGALARLMEDEPVEGVAADLPSSWRPALRGVARDIAAPDADESWIAASAARVAAVLGRQDREGAEALDAELSHAMEGRALDDDARAYLRVLRGALAGRDQREASLALVEPYRSAYFSLVEILRGADPRKGLIDRVRDNAILVLREGDEQTERGLSAALESVEREAEEGGEDELARFVGAVRARVEDRPAPAPELEDPELVAAWRAVVETERGPR